MLISPFRCDLLSELWFRFDPSLSFETDCFFMGYALILSSPGLVLNLATIGYYWSLPWSRNPWSTLQTTTMHQRNSGFSYRPVTKIVSLSQILFYTQALGKQPYAAIFPTVPINCFLRIAVCCFCFFCLFEPSAFCFWLISLNDIN